MALTKRLVKGSAITAAEHDANLDHVQDRAHHTGTQAIASISGLGSGDNLLMTAAERTNLSSAAQIHAEAIGDGAATSIAVTHNLGTRDVVVQLYDATTFAEVIPDVTRTDANTVTLAFGSAPTAGQYRVVVQG